MNALLALVARNRVTRILYLLARARAALINAANAVARKAFNSSANNFFLSRLVVGSSPTRLTKQVCLFRTHR